MLQHVARENQPALAQHDDGIFDIFSVVISPAVKDGPLVETRIELVLGKLDRAGAGGAGGGEILRAAFRARAARTASARNWAAQFCASISLFSA